MIMNKNKMPKELENYIRTLGIVLILALVLQILEKFFPQPILIVTIAAMMGILFGIMDLRWRL